MNNTHAEKGSLQYFRKANELWNNKYKTKAVTRNDPNGIYFLKPAAEGSYEQELLVPATTWGEWFKEVDQLEDAEARARFLLLMLGILYVQADSESDRSIFLRAYGLAPNLLYSGPFSGLSSPYYKQKTSYPFFK